MTRLVHIVNAGLTALLTGGSLWVYPRLPARIPRHFGVGGTADAYWATTLVHWMLLPGVAIGLAGLLYGAAWAIGRAPASISVPNQQQFDPLPPAKKRVVAGDVQRFLYGTATATLVLFLGLQGRVFQVAVTARDAMPEYGVLVTIGIPVGIVGAALGLTWWIPRRVRRLAEEA